MAQRRAALAGVCAVASCTKHGSTSHLATYVAGLLLAGCLCIGMAAPSQTPVPALKLPAMPANYPYPQCWTTTQSYDIDFVGPLKYNQMGEDRRMMTQRQRMQPVPVHCSSQIIGQETSTGFVMDRGSLQKQLGEPGSSCQPVERLQQQKTVSTLAATPLL